MKRQVFFFIFCVLCMGSNLLHAQRVALVLSGGGAKGLAYIGALKALEENGVPIDYVIGTSMGGLVGGFYAAGFSPSEMEDIVLSERFQNWAKGKITDDEKIYIFQQQQEPSMVSFRIGFDTLFATNLKTNNLIPDHGLNLGLMEYLSKASARAKYNFDSLMIPFRCVTAEIFTQTEVILDKGNLNEALRATMAVPLFFSPQQVNGMYLFDGGLYNNFPVNRAKELFKPDIVIGFNVSDKIFSEYPYDHDDNYVDSRLLNYLLLSKSDTTQLDENDIYIQPDLQGYSSMSFADVRQLIAIGYRATKAKMPLIKRRIAEERDSLYYDQRRKDFLAEEKEYKIDRVKVEGFKNAARLEKYFKADTSGYFPISSIRNGYYILDQCAAYEKLSPSLVYDSAHAAYRYKLRLKHNKDLKIALGGVISNRPISYLFVSLEKDFFPRKRHNFYANGYIGVFYLSNHTRARVYFPSYNTSYFEGSFTYNKWDFYQTSNLFELTRENESIVRQNEINAKISIKSAIRKKGMVGMSVAYLNSQARYSALSVILPDDTLSYSSFKAFHARVDYENNKLDKVQYPRQGHYFQLDCNYYTGLETFSPGTLERNTVSAELFANENFIEAQRSWVALQLKMGKLFRIKRTFTVGLSTHGYLSTQPFFFNHKATAFYAKPFTPLSDSYTLYFEDFRMSNFIAAGLTNILSVHKNIDLRGEIHPFYDLLPVKYNHPNGGFGVDDQYHGDEPELRFAAAAGFVYHFFLGPISAQVTYYDTRALSGSSNFGFVVHAGFLLRNKRWDD